MAAFVHYEVALVRLHSKNVESRIACYVGLNMVGCNQDICNLLSPDSVEPNLNYVGQRPIFCRRTRLLKRPELVWFTAIAAEV